MNNPFESYSLGEEIQILPELSGGKLTWNPETFQVKLYFENNSSPEEIKSQRETVEALEKEVKDLKRIKEYDVEEFESKVRQLRKAENFLTFMLSEYRLTAICQFENDEDIKTFKEHGRNCKKKTVGSFAFATGRRAKDTPLEDLQKFPIPNTNYGWYNV